MTEYAIYINSETRDFEFDDDGFIKTVEDKESYAQGVEILLRTFKGEFFLLPNHGTDYDKLLGVNSKYVDDELIKSVIRAGIFQSEHIKQIDNLDVDISPDKRVVGVSFAVTSYSDDVISGRNVVI